ncbi:proline-rich protein 7 isoform X1 [Pezoporus flaviventris]|uniref:proline-rich protein 7 isoform X1 n=1 Tax=Pezoporus flaviventris TaxID=889875 RepID=UPI002AB1A118|nr:proline-rich protein 7 isoform X1 [Pezoporus flaviventris]
MAAAPCPPRVLLGHPHNRRAGSAGRPRPRFEVRSQEASFDKLPAAAGETAAGGAAAGAEPTCAGAGAAALRGLWGQPPRHRHSPPPAPRAPPSSPPPHPSPPALELPARGPGGLCLAESDLSKPPCYEEALLMAEPPPPYSEVLMDTRGLYRKINAPFLSHERLEKQEQPPSYKPLFLDAGYGSSLHLPRSASPGPACPDLYLQAECSPRMFPSWTDSELSSRDTYEPGPWHLPVSMPLFGRTTAV